MTSTIADSIFVALPLPRFALSDFRQSVSLTSRQTHREKVFTGMHGGSRVRRSPGILHFVKNTDNMVVKENSQNFINHLGLRHHERTPGNFNVMVRAQKPSR